MAFSRALPHIPIQVPRLPQTLGASISVARLHSRSIVTVATPNSSRMPPIITPTVLRNIANTPHLPSTSWYLVASVTLSALNRPEEIPEVFKYALEHYAKKESLSEDYVRKQYEAEIAAASANGGGKVSENTAVPREGEREDALKITRKIREALLKAGAINGLPKSINSLHSLRHATPPHLRSTPDMQPPLSGTLPTPTARSVPTLDPLALPKDDPFFAHLYGKITSRVSSALTTSYIDLGLYARVAYAYLLGNTNVLSPKETSFVIVAGLIPQDVNPQLKGHLKGAVNNGASKEEVRAVREVVIELCRLAGVNWKGEVANL